MSGEEAEWQELAEAARAYCEEVLAPLVEEDDAEERFRPEIMATLGEYGLCGIPTPEEYGGLGYGYQAYCRVLEEVAKVSASYAVSIAVTGLPQFILAQMGTEQQKQRWLPGLAEGRLLGAFALSEPGSGSDAASLMSRAVRDGDDYVLDGTKFWITHGGYADVYVVMARTGASSRCSISW